MEELKDYIKRYTRDKMLLEVEVNEYDVLEVRPSIPNVYLLYKVLNLYQES